MPSARKQLSEVISTSTKTTWDARVGKTNALAKLAPFARCLFCSQRPASHGDCTFSSVVADLLSPKTQKRHTYKDNHVLDILQLSDNEGDDADVKSVASDDSTVSGFTEIIPRETDDAWEEKPGLTHERVCLKRAATPKARKSLLQPSNAHAHAQVTASPLKRRRSDSDSEDDAVQEAATPSKRTKMDCSVARQLRGSVGVNKTPSKSTSVCKTPSRTPSRRIVSTPKSSTKTTTTPSRNRAKTQAETPRSSRKSAATPKRVPLKPLHKDQEVSYQRFVFRGAWWDSGATATQHCYVARRMMCTCCSHDSTEN